MDYVSVKFECFTFKLKDSNKNHVNPSLNVSTALCEAGSYITGDMTKCEACTDNSYSYEGAVSCITCPVGTFVNEDNTYCGELEHVRPG